MEATYWLVGVRFKFVNKKEEIQDDERTWTVWADSVSHARTLSLGQWHSRKPKTLIEDSEKWLPSRKLTPQEIRKMESLFKK